MKNTYWKNKNIVIAGGTAGLGKALACKLSSLEAHILVIGRRDSAIKEMAKEYPKIAFLKADISNKEAIHPLAAQVHTHFSRIDMLFNIASYLGEVPLRPLMDTDCEDFERVLQTNLLAPFRLTKVLAPTMILGHSGLVINISSDAAINAYATWGAYSVSKAAVDHLSRIFHEELKSMGVGFLSVDPGDMATAMHFAAIPTAKKEDLRSPDTSAQSLMQLIEKLPSQSSKNQVRRIL